MDLSKINIDDLQLTLRARQACVALGARTLADVRAHGRAKIAAQKNAGDTTAHELMREVLLHELSHAPPDLGQKNKTPLAAEPRYALEDTVAALQQELDSLRGDLAHLRASLRSIPDA